MDPKETARLMRLIQERGHDMAYDERTRQELDGWGIRGMAEMALGDVPVHGPQPGDVSITACITIAPGEQLARPDNKTGPCAWGCGRRVQFRPWVTLPTVCLYCCAERSLKDQ